MHTKLMIHNKRKLDSLSNSINGSFYVHVEFPYVYIRLQAQVFKLLTQGLSIIMMEEHQPGSLSIDHYNFNGS